MPMNATRLITRVALPILLVGCAPLTFSKAATTATASNSADNVSANQQQVTSAKWGITFSAANSDFTGSTSNFGSASNPVVRTIPFLMTNVSTVALGKWTMNTTTTNINPNRNYQIKICTGAFTGTVCGGTETILQPLSTTNVTGFDSVEGSLPVGPTTYQGLVIVTRTAGLTPLSTDITLRATVSNISSNTDLGAPATISN
jgi:hypothetical protein